MRYAAERQLSRAWLTWSSEWASRRLILRRLRAATSRLARPLLAASFAGWRRSWFSAALVAAAAARSEAARQHARERGELFDELAMLRAEVAGANQATGSSLPSAYARHVVVLLADAKSLFYGVGLGFWDQRKC